MTAVAVESRFQAPGLFAGVANSKARGERRTNGGKSPRRRSRRADACTGAHGRSNRSIAPKSPPARRCIDRGPVRRQSQSTMPFRGYWDDEEEQALRDAVQKHGIGSWEKMRHDPDFKVLK